jgi:hypothetical protein
MPAPGRWWVLAPALIACAIPLRGWIPLPLGLTPPEFAASLGAGLVAITAAELWFRGLVHGMLSLEFRIQHPAGPRFLSRAAVVSALAYATVATSVTAPALPSDVLSTLGLGVPLALGCVAASALLAGLILGGIRERSLSIASGLSLQMLGIAASAAIWSLLQ